MPNVTPPTKVPAGNSIIPSCAIIGIPFKYKLFVETTEGFITPNNPYKEEEFKYLKNTFNFESNTLGNLDNLICELIYNNNKFEFLRITILLLHCHTQVIHCKTNDISPFID